MRIILLFMIALFVNGCAKTKTVLICGDHICINKSEAEEYFEENLSLEVKIIKKKDKKTDIDLVELNMKPNPKGEREIRIVKKEKTKKKLKKLSKKEIKERKIELRAKQKNKLKKINKDIEEKKVKLNKTKSKQEIKKDVQKTKKIQKNLRKEIVDICTILEKCNIDEISKYLIKEGRNKKFPDITLRE